MAYLEIAFRALMFYLEIRKIIEWGQKKLSLTTDKRMTVRSMLIKILQRRKREKERERERERENEWGANGVSDVERYSIFFLSSM